MEESIELINQISTLPTVDRVEFILSDDFAVFKPFRDATLKMLKEALKMLSNEK